jgi:hypothetical protein
MNASVGTTQKQERFLPEDLVRLAFASRTLLEQRPDLRHIERDTLAGLTLEHILRGPLPPRMLDAFSPRCTYFRGVAAIVTDPAAQRVLAQKEISGNAQHALPAALSGLSLSDNCRSIAAFQLLALTDPLASDFSDQLARFRPIAMPLDEKLSEMHIRRR